MKLYSEDVLRASEVLKNGGIILYPTDTIWGIGCDATNEKSVARIFALKKREDSKSMIVLLPAEKQISYYAENIFPIPKQALAKPTTIIYPNAKNLASNLIADDGSIGIRIVQDEFCKQLISLLGRPIVSTSANFSGSAPPRIFSEISEGIKAGVDYVVRHRQEDPQQAKPSAIIKLTANGYEVIRE